MACTVALAAQTTWAGPAEVASAWALSAWTAGQIPSRSAADRRQESNRLLGQASSAMRQGELDKAEQLVAIETATVGEDCADSESASISESA